MLEWIILIVSLVGLIYAGYHAYIGIAGNLKKLDPIPYAQPQFRIAALIPARNEEKVVGLAVASLLKQRYPKDLFDVYVMPNNCSDQTEQAALRAGARVLPCEADVHSKGEVLHCTFEKLIKGERPYDAFVIFDADNIVDAGFMQATNNALAAGYNVGQGYRDSKNPDDNWIAGCTSVFFWFMNRLFNHARAALGLSASLNGTGIMFSRAFIERNGYVTTTLTEDLEMSAQCALAGERIAWMEEAITYDEQPLSFKDSFTQRRRWAAGTRQCARKYIVKLYKNGRKNRNCLDVALHFTGVFAMALGLIPGLLTVLVLGRGIIENPALGIKEALLTAAVALVGCVLAGALMTFLVCSLEGKLKKQRIVDALAMGWFLVTWLPANILGYLGKPPAWKEIPHTIEMSIEECDGQSAEAIKPKPADQKGTTL